MNIETQVCTTLTQLALSLTEGAKEDPQNPRLPVLVDLATMLTEVGAKMNVAPVSDPREQQSFWEVMHDMIRATQLAQDAHSNEWAMVLHGLTLICLSEPDVFLMFVDKVKEATFAITKEMCNCPECTQHRKEGGDTPH